MKRFVLVLSLVMIVLLLVFLNCRRDRPIGKALAAESREGPMKCGEGEPAYIIH